MRALKVGAVLLTLCIPSTYQRAWLTGSAQHILRNRTFREIWSVPKDKVREETLWDQRLIAKEGEEREKRKGEQSKVKNKTQGEQVLLTLNTTCQWMEAPTAFQKPQQHSTQGLWGQCRILYKASHNKHNDTFTINNYQQTESFSRARPFTLVVSLNHHKNAIR